MKILGIGNAIVDVICKVDDNFIEQNNLTKSTMKLFFDEKEFHSIEFSPPEVVGLRKGPMPTPFFSIEDVPDPQEISRFFEVVRAFANPESIVE